MSKKAKFLLIIIILLLVVAGVLLIIHFSTEKNAEMLYNKIYERFRLGSPSDIKIAIEKFRYLASRYPDSKYARKALFRIGNGYELLYKLTDDPDKLDIAQREYFFLVKRYPHSLEAQKALLRIAHIDYIRGYYEDAIDRLNYLLERYPATPLKAKIYTEKGWNYLSLGNFKFAIANFTKPENANQPEALLGKAEAYFKLGEVDRAISIYEELIHYRKATVIWKRSKERFLKLTYKYARSLSRNGEYERANRYFLKIVQLFPDTTLAENSLFWIGENYYDLKLYNKAIEFYEKVKANNIYSRDDVATFKIGICYFEQKDFVKALEYFNQFLYMYPDSPYKDLVEKWKEQTLREIKYRNIAY